jgi:competence ComEA-like helix-hairpin-helix protein
MNDLDELAEGMEDSPELDLTEPQDATPEVSEQVEEPLPEPEAVADTKELPELGAEETEPEPAEEVAIVDLNTATETDLRQLPGVGPALAARIVSYRDEAGAFADPAGIVAVPGITQAIYERIADRLTASPIEPPSLPEPEPAEAEAFEPEPEPLAGEEPFEPGPEPAAEVAAFEPEPEPVAGEESFEPEPEPAAEEEPLEAVWEPVEEGVPEAEPEPVKAEARPPRGPEPPLVEVVPAPVGWGRFLFIGLLSAVVGAAIALAVLFALNRTLDFQTASTRALRAEAYRLDGELETLRGDLTQVESELAAMQDLGPQVKELQASISSMSRDLEAAQAELDSAVQELQATQESVDAVSATVTGLEEGMAALQTDVDELEQQLAATGRALREMNRTVQRFDAFLDGLRLLLEESASPASPSLSPEATRPTPTSQPLVTVIPLATPTSTP